MIAGAYRSAPWCGDIITRKDACKLLDITGEELDQRGIPCCFVANANGGFQLIYEPWLFMRIMGRMRDEMAERTTYLATVDAENEILQYGLTAH